MLFLISTKTLKNHTRALLCLLDFGGLLLLGGLEQNRTAIKCLGNIYSIR